MNTGGSARAEHREFAGRRRPRGAALVVTMLALVWGLVVAGAGSASAMGEGAGDGSGGEGSSVWISLVPPTSSAIRPSDAGGVGQRPSAPATSAQITLIPPTSSAIAPARATGAARRTGGSTAARIPGQHSAGQQPIGQHSAGQRAVDRPVGMAGVQDPARPDAAVGRDATAVVDAATSSARWLLLMGAATLLIIVGAVVLGLARVRRHRRDRLGS